MYGIILRLDAGRQQRVGTEPLQKLLSPAVYKKVQERRSSLNASVSVLNPFAPTLVRPSFYPDYFRATDIRTLFWKVKNFDGLHNLHKVYVDENSRIVFEFDDNVAAEQAEALTRVLKDYGHFEFVEPKQSGTKVTYTVQSGSYAEPEAGEVNV